MVGSSEKDRETEDFYRTPTYATNEILNREKLYGTIWEPACGDGAISEVLKHYNYPNVYSTDINDYGYGDVNIDFLNVNDIIQCNHIITNPPYKYAQEFVEKSLKVADGKVIMLLKLNFLEGQKRFSFFQSTPLKNIYVFSKRLSFDKGNEKGKGNGLLAYAWYVWEKGYVGRPQIGWIL